MQYVFHNPDGKIEHAQKVYLSEQELRAYEQRLTDEVKPFIAVEGVSGLLNPDKIWINEATPQLLCDRPTMPVTVDRTKIIAGGSDTLVIRNIPRAATIRVLSSNIEIYAPMALDTDEVEMSIPVPCVYRFEFELWPYQTCVVEVEAVQS